MADYLSHLIVKNLSPQENIQPRPRGRFEPSPDISVNISMAEMAQAGEPQSIASPIADSAASTSQPGRMQPSQLPSRPFFAHLIEKLDPPPALPPAPPNPRPAMTAATPRRRVRRLPMPLLT